MFTVISGMLSAWAGVLIVMVAAILVALAAMVWIFVFRKNTRRRRKRRYHYDGPHQPNPTLAQIGGLPPVREPGKPDQAQTPTLMSQS